MVPNFMPDRADEAASLRTQGGGNAPVRVSGVPGAARAPSAEERREQDEHAERAAEVAAIERQLTAKRGEVRQLQLVCADQDCASRDNYRPRLKQAEAEMLGLEDAIKQLNSEE